MTEYHKEMIDKLEATIKEAQFQIEELKKPKSNQWKPEEGEVVYYLELDGKVAPFVRGKAYGSQNRIIDSGNYFKTEEDAKNSLKFLVMNSEYDYWISGVSTTKPTFEPKGLEYLVHGSEKWASTGTRCCRWSGCTNYRWKRSEQ
jgi:hypothetical protein